MLPGRSGNRSKYCDRLKTRLDEIARSIPDIFSSDGAKRAAAARQWLGQVPAQNSTFFSTTTIYGVLHEHSLI